MRTLLLCAALLAANALGAAGADFQPPPTPTQFVTDGARILSPATASALDAQLAAFQRQTSNQILVVTLPAIPGDLQMEDFTQRTAEAWGVGRKATDNGVVLFIFPNQRKMRIEVGYGLEGALPDALAKSIISNEITPAFRSGQFDSGVTRGVAAIMQATQGEYTGNPGTGEYGIPVIKVHIVVAVFIVFIFVMIIANFIALSRQRGRSVTSRGGSWRDRSGGGGFWGGGGSSSGGGWSSSSGGGFSSGGGSFGGGGASGSW